MRRRRERGAVMLEYALVVALLVLAVAFAVPDAIALFGYAYEVLASVVCSPFPAGF